MKTRQFAFSSDTGSAIIEFLGFGLVLQITVLLGLIQFSNMQSQQLAAESIARHALRAYMLSNIQPQETAKQLSLDLGEASQPKFDFSCQPDCESVGSVLKLGVSLGQARAMSVAVR